MLKKSTECRTMMTNTITLNKISVIIKVIYDIFQAEQKKFITCLQGKH